MGGKFIPTLTRYFIKTSLIYLLIALLLGAAIILDNFLNLPVFLQFMSPAFFHLFMLGWVTQLIFGVAWWMFPLLPERTKGNEKLGWLLYILLNSGLIMRLISEPQLSIKHSGLLKGLLVFSALIQVLAGFLFARLLWPRVRAKTSKVKITPHKVGPL